MSSDGQPGRGPVRVLVADDSRVTRRALAAVLAADPGLRVVGEAADGRQAVEMVERLRPDVVTMDIHMPGLDGFGATRRIMERAPTPVVIVSADYEPAQVSRSFEAIEAGALTVVGKPVAPTSADFAGQAAILVETVKLMAEVRVVGRRRPERPEPPAPPPPTGGVTADVVAMAASTGGPAALATVLSGLPADLGAPVLVVQHISAGFEPGLVRWLDGLTPLSVAVAKEGDQLEAGRVLVSPADGHLCAGRDRVRVSDDPPVGEHRPSATSLFLSVARSHGNRALGVVLTGMGSDGVEGLRALKAAGGTVLAQDEASSVVYGMPARAVEAGVVDHVVPLPEMATRIVQAVGTGARR